MTRGLCLAAIVLAVCVFIGAPFRAQAGAMPLAVTAMLVQSDRGRGVYKASVAHALALLVGAAVKATTSHLMGCGLIQIQPTGTWIVGEMLLIALQAGVWRHPPALASGGAAMADISVLVLLAQLGAATCIVTRHETQTLNKCAVDMD